MTESLTRAKKECKTYEGHSIKRLRSMAKILPAKANMYRPLHEDFEIKRATTIKELEDAYQSVWEVFKATEQEKQGQIYLTPNEREAGIRIRKWELLPEMATFVAKHKSGKTAGVMSVVPYTLDFKVPLGQTFQNELEKIVQERKEEGVEPKIWEYTNWATRKEYKKLGLTTELTRVGFAHLRKIKGQTDLVGEVNLNHVGMYEFILFKNIAKGDYNGSEVAFIRKKQENLDERYKKLDRIIKGNPSIYNWYIGENPYLDKVEEWEKQASQEIKQNNPLESLLPLAISQESVNDKEIQKVIQKWNIAGKKN